VIVQVGEVNRGFAEKMEAAGIGANRFKFAGDYYSLPNVLPLLALPSMAELVEAIMRIELPTRTV
jgi:hypothetical protein